MRGDYLEFMGKIIDKGHASAIPSKEVPPPPGRSWYLPHFATYHNTKRTIRVVFDSSCEFGGNSSNKVLLSGPDLMNNLIGVLMRFRKENIAVMCDIEQMFHSYYVDPPHRDFLRFLWFESNDPSKPIIEYQTNVYLFGNGPSAAVATYGLRRTAIDGEEEYGEEAKKFICRNFYVDDGLTSLSSIQGATDLVKSTQATLATTNLRLHKVVTLWKTWKPSRPKTEQKTCVTWIDATTACLLNAHSGYSGTWRQTPSTLRYPCRRSHSQGKEYCPSSTLCTTRLASQYLLCSKREKYCSTLSIWGNGQRRTIPPWPGTTPSLPR